MDNGILIPWGNRETYNRYKVALDVQDAVNPLALAREFVKVVDSAMADRKSTKDVWDDAAVILFINKFESMSRSDDRFSAAYRVCDEEKGAS